MPYHVVPPSRVQNTKMSVSPLAGASGAVPPAHSTEAGHVTVCVPPAVSSRTKPTLRPEVTDPNVKVVLPLVVKLNAPALSASGAGVVPDRAS
jgi:hypothetical protein